MFFEVLKKHQESIVGDDMVDGYDVELVELGVFWTFCLSCEVFSPRMFIMCRALCLIV
jgi:hypothetical protein